MDREQMKKMIGQGGGDAKPFYKLNEVQMSGDDGHFYLRDVLTERKEGEKTVKIDLGEELRGVILRMRWKLSKYKEEASGGTFISSTEYDDKNTDEVMIFPAKERGTAVGMKEKYALATQRVIYFYLTERDEVVRFIVKSSAMTNENNPKDKNGQPKGFGLFNYQSELANDDVLPNEVITVAKGIYREDPNGNKRKNYWATTFSNGGEVEDASRMQQLTVEIYEKTSSKSLPNISTPKTPSKDSMDYPTEEIDPNSIPF